MQLKKTEGEVDAEIKFKKTVKENIMSKPAQIISQYKGTVTSATTLPSNEQLRQRIAYKRKQEFDDPNIRSEIIKTVDDENFLLHESENEDIVILSTDQNLQRLFNNLSWMADGTFSLAPVGYCQIFTIFANIYDRWISLINFIMKNRTQEKYIYAWNKLIDYANNLHCDIPSNPHIMLDFEKASANAVKICFTARFLDVTSIFGKRF